MLRGSVARKTNARQAAQINALTKRVEQLEADQIELIGIVKELTDITRGVSRTATEAHQYASMARPIGGKR